MAGPMRQHTQQNFLVVESREEILSLSPVLETLAERCAQPAAMHWLSYFLDPAVLGKRAPRLVLLLQSDEARVTALKVAHIRAAALYFEYELWGFRTGVIATGDAVGFNTVIAPEELRTQMAVLASRELLQRGAHSLVTTFETGETQDLHWPAVREQKLRWAVRIRRVPRMLKLGRTMDETLAKMGKTTRWNLKYYRRRLEKQMRCEFVPEAAPLLRGSDLNALNAASLNPVEAGEFKRRVEAATDLPGSFLCGLRTHDGEWLSLIGGWRQGDVTVLYWQMNACGFEKHSLGTVMRSFFIEAEIAAGASTLLIYGGTPHAMRHAFTEDTVTDLLVQRPGVRTLAVRKAAQFLLSSKLLGRGNFVAEALCDQNLCWHTTRVGAKQEQSPVLKPARAHRAA